MCCSSARHVARLSRESRLEARFASLSCVYHVELRQFPHNFCRFNLTERELRETVIDGWARGEWIELGERKWNSHQANLTVLEGPELPVQQLAIGRGWRNAVRQSKDVTADLLAQARTDESTKGTVGESMSSEPVTTSPRIASERANQGLVDDSLARDLLMLLGDDPDALVRAWQLALERHPDRTPSECLALAEDLVRR